MQSCKLSSTSELCLIDSMRLVVAIAIFAVLPYARAQVNNGSNQGTVVYARVDPTGLSTGGTGIRGVTQTNLTQTSTDIVRNFFTGGGVVLPAAGTPTGGGLVSSGVPVSLVTTSPAQSKIPSNPLKLRRDQLVGLHSSLVAVITSKLAAHQSPALEIAQKSAVERELARLDRQLAANGIPPVARGVSSTAWVHVRP